MHARLSMARTLRTPGRRPSRASPIAVVCALLLALSVAGPAAVAAQDAFPEGEDLRVMLRYLVEDGATPGIVLGVLDPDGSTRTVYAGTAGPGARPLGPRTVFEIGSITKTFTGTLLALAVRRGEVSLEDPVAMYLPDSVRVPSWNGRHITLLDLATHRSGLPGIPDNLIPVDLGDPYAAYTLEGLYDFLSSHDLRRAPGSEAEYSNLGFGLLGHALARAAGTSYAELLRDRILDPLGMDRTGFAGDEPDAWLAQPHAAGQVVPPWSAAEAIRGAGGLRSTVEDMLRYLAANVGPPETELEHAMRDAHRARSDYDGDHGIGLAWRIDRRGDRPIVLHGGATAGSSARIAFDPERGTGFVRLTNTGGFGSDIGLYLLRTAPPIDEPTVAVAPEVLERYVGAYAFSPDTNLFIRLEEDGTLTSQLKPTVRYRLYPTAVDSFYLKRLKTRIVFRTDAAGEVEGLVLGARGGRTLAKVSDETPPPAVVDHPELRDIALNPEEVARYTGEYAIETPGGSIDVRIGGEGGGLVARVAGGPPNRLRHQGGHVFVPADDPRSRVMFTVRDDRAVSFTLDLRGERITARRAGADEPEILDLPLTAEEMAVYEGTYLLGARDLPLRIWAGDGRLLSRAGGQRVTPLRYQGDHVFVPDFDDTVRLIFVVEDGRATRLTLYQGGRAVPAERQR